MPVTGSPVPQHPSPGHQTSGCDSEEHLDRTNHSNEYGDGSTNGLLRGQGGVDIYQDESIYAAKGVQRNGQMAGRKASFDGCKSRFTEVLPPLVSLLNLYYVSSAVKRCLPLYFSAFVQRPSCSGFFFLHQLRVGVAVGRFELHESLRPRSFP